MYKERRIYSILDCKYISILQKEEKKQKIHVQLSTTKSRGMHS